MPKRVHLLQVCLTRKSGVGEHAARRLLALFADGIDQRQQSMIVVFGLHHSLGDEMVLADGDFYCFIGIAGTTHVVVTVNARAPYSDETGNFTESLEILSSELREDFHEREIRMSFSLDSNFSERLKRFVLTPATST